MNFHDWGTPEQGNYPPEGSVEKHRQGESEPIAHLFRQTPALRWVLVLCGVLGLGLAACLLMHPRTAAAHGSVASGRCVCR